MSRIDSSIVNSLIQNGYSEWADYYQSLVEAQAYWSGCEGEDEE